MWHSQTNPLKIRHIHGTNRFVRKADATRKKTTQIGLAADTRLKKIKLLFSLIACHDSKGRIKTAPLRLILYRNQSTTDCENKNSCKISAGKPSSPIIP